jgi:anti-sigma factor RsiW
MNCTEAKALVSAHADGELDRLRAHALEKHLRGCADCAAALESMVALRQRVRAEVPRYPASSELQARVRAAIGAAEAAAPAKPRPERRWQWLSAGALAGCAATVVAWVLGTAVLDARSRDELAAEAVASHVRATLNDHLIQVASSDQHTVKPWLSARLDYSPPVRDMAQEDGFTLVGGRLDSLEKRQVATLVYRYRLHNVDVFVRPEAWHTAAEVSTLRGFNVAHANGSGMDWLAVSDVNPEVLSAFVQRLAREAGGP